MVFISPKAVYTHFKDYVKSVQRHIWTMKRRRMTPDRQWLYARPKETMERFAHAQEKHAIRGLAPVTNCVKLKMEVERQSLRCLKRRPGSSIDSSRRTLVPFFYTSWEQLKLRSPRIFCKYRHTGRQNFFLDISAGFDIIIKLSCGSELHIVQFS